ncbi:L-rhamnose mutarotase [Agromyces silvae]|uniref:L-rhamnose mutarotase n=1 Tax=Agromyces silvae TaxID=3388266 RepID=UPI00280BFDFC|nr:L-rhamnose mutarotase [Agromyces protaetiae]
MSTEPPVRYLYRLRPGAGPEYDRRHREVWPELTALLRAEGVHDYEIFRHEEIVVCSLRTREPFGETMARLAAHDVQRAWTEALGDLFEAVADEEGRPLYLTRVFRLEDE